MFLWIKYTFPLLVWGKSEMVPQGLFKGISKRTSNCQWDQGGQWPWERPIPVWGNQREWSKYFLLIQNSKGETKIASLFILKQPWVCTPPNAFLPPNPVLNIVQSSEKHREIPMISSLTDQRWAHHWWYKLRVPWWLYQKPMYFSTYYSACKTFSKSKASACSVPETITTQLRWRQSWGQGWGQGGGG